MITTYIMADHHIHAPAENRTRGETMATFHFTTKPLVRESRVNYLKIRISFYSAETDAMKQMLSPTKPIAQILQLFTHTQQLIFYDMKSWESTHKSRYSIQIQCGLLFLLQLILVNKPHLQFF